MSLTEIISLAWTLLACSTHVISQVDYLYWGRSRHSHFHCSRALIIPIPWSHRSNSNQ